MIDLRGVDGIDVTDVLMCDNTLLARTVGDGEKR